MARELGVDLSLVSIKPTNVLTNANGSVTGGSFGSELNCYVSCISIFYYLKIVFYFVYFLLGGAESLSRAEGADAAH